MKPTLLSALVMMILSVPTFAADPGTPGGLPPGEKEAKAVLDKSPRHGEFVEIAVPGAKTPLKSYIVYPERKDKAPVVIVIHEIFGLSDWVRSVADQLAAEGFIAIAPDMLSGHGPNGGGTESLGGRQDVMRAVSGLPRDEVTRDLDAVREYGMKLPAASGKTATIGFCWGGGQSFGYATHQPDLAAAVVYYGVPPAKDAMEKIKAPVAGFYGGNDARITATVDPTSQQMKQMSKTYDPHVYDGAGHGFLRAQDNNEANKKAAEQAWPATIQFLREHTK
jgi:carboxymethylenebutenolidase